MKVDLPDIKSVKSGSTNVKKICRGSRELWPDYQKSIIIHGYITPNAVSTHKEIDLGLYPSKNTRLEMYLFNANATMGNGVTNLGLITNKIYPDNNDWRFFWTSNFYFDMASGRANYSLRSSSYYNKMFKFECSKTAMKITRCSDDYLIYNGSMSVSGEYIWDRETLKLEPYHSNNGYMRWYLIRIYEGDNKIMELYPINKPDYGWCFMDNVSGNYFYNPESPSWTYTETTEYLEIL